MDTSLIERQLENERLLNSLVVDLTSRGWTLRCSTTPGGIQWIRTPQDPDELPVAVEGSSLPSVTLEACRMELVGPVTQPRSPSGAEPSPAVPSSPVSASTSRRAS
jgi:hypothetical protein